MQTFTQFLLKHYRKEYEVYQEEDLNLMVKGGLGLGPIEEYFKVNHKDIFKEYLFKNLKGHIVRYKAIVKSSYKPSNYIGEQWKLHIGQDSPKYRGIYRLDLNCEGFDIKGIALGYSYLNTGWYQKSMGASGPYYDNYEPAQFNLDKSIKVFVIEELNNDNRYYKPVYVLPEDVVF